MIEQKKIRIASGSLKIEAGIKHNVIMLRKQVLQERSLAHLTGATDNSYRKIFRQPEQTV